jgi:hypothetical protein
VAIGVVEDLTELVAHDVTLDPDLLEAQLDADAFDPALDVDAFVEWSEFVQSFGDIDVPPTAPTVAVLTDLDLVRDDAWPRVLSRLAQSPLRSAVTTPVRVHFCDGSTRSVRSYPGWWLAGSALLQGRALREYRLADADPVLAALYPPVPEVADAEFLVAAGVWTRAEDLLAEPGGADELLDRLLRPAGDLDARQLAAVYAVLGTWAEQASEDRWPQPRQQLRVLDAGGSRVVGRGDCVVVTAPHHLPMAPGPHLVGSPMLADLLDLEVLQPPGVLPGPGTERAVPSPLAAAVAGVDTFREHDDLVVDRTRVDWWIDHDLVLHAATLDGLARAVAWHSGQWSRRFELAAMLSDPDGWDAGGESAFDA